MKDRKYNLSEICFKSNLEYWLFPFATSHLGREGGREGGKKYQQLVTGHIFRQYSAYEI
jgi:hypothetical protein